MVASFADFNSGATADDSAVILAMDVSTFDTADSDVAVASLDSGC